MAKRVLIAGPIAALCALGSIAAGSALGAEYVYRVSKAVLGVGQTQKVTLKAKTNQTLSSTILGIKFEVVCKKVKLNAAEEPVIKGGAPGTLAKDKFEFAECEATLGAERCKEATVEGSNLVGEIVTVVRPEAKAGELATKLSSAGTEGSFVTVKVAGCGSFSAKFTGSAAVLDIPEKAEQPVGTLAAKSGGEEITAVQKSNGTQEAVGLKCLGVKATFAGESELALVSNASWGVF